MALTERPERRRCGTSLSGEGLRAAVDVEGHGEDVGGTGVGEHSASSECDEDTEECPRRRLCASSE